MRVIAEKLVEQAIAGEGWAIQQVADRIDGKPAQEQHAQRSITSMTDSDCTRDELGCDHPIRRQELLEAAAERLWRMDAETDLISLN